MSSPHEYFEERCSLAADGHLSSDEMSELEEHLAGCESCSDFYRDMISLTTGLNLEAEAVFADPPMSARKVPPDTREPAVLNMPAPSHRNPVPMTPVPRWTEHYGRVAAAAVFGVLLGAGGVSLQRFNRNAASTATIAPTAATVAATRRAAIPDENTREALAAAQSRIALLQLELAHAAATDQSSSATVAAAPMSQNDRQKQTAALQSRIAELAEKGTVQHDQIAALSAEIDKLRQAHDQDTQTLQARDARIRLLTTDLLADDTSTPPPGASSSVATPSVADLLGQRNLHVIDIYDESSHGQRTAAFGRVFYGEGASLLFYAFDLPVKQGSDKIVVQAWGQQEGSSKNPVQLGVFSQSDPSLRRWVLRVKNPAQLSKIDAVFVTLERREEKKPMGTPMLYAYLRQAPNHP